MGIRGGLVAVTEKNAASEDQTVNHVIGLLESRITNLLLPLFQNILIERETCGAVLLMIREIIIELLRLGVLSVTVHRGNGAGHEILVGIPEGFDVRILLNCIQIRLPHGIRNGKIRDQQKILRGLVIWQQHAAIGKCNLQGLCNHAAAVNALTVGAFLDSEHGPVNCKRFGQNPVQIAVFLIHFQNIGGRKHRDLLQPSDTHIIRNQLDFLFILHSRRQLFRERSSRLAERLGQHGKRFVPGLLQHSIKGRIRFERSAQGVFSRRSGGKHLPVRIMPAENRHHAKRHLIFVITLGIVKDIAQLMLINPSKFLVKHRIVRVVLHGLMIKIESAVDPAPAVHRRTVGHGNIVCHVPGKIGRRCSGLRLQFHDPRCKLNHFEILALILQRDRAQPEKVRDQPPESAKRDSRKRHHRRRSFNELLINQLVLADAVVQTRLNKHVAGQKKKSGHKRDKNDRTFLSHAVTRPIASLPGQLPCASRDKYPADRAEAPSE